MTSPTAPAIEAVLFDYGMVLSQGPDPAVWLAMHELLAASEDAFAAAYWSVRDLYDRGTLSGHAYWSEVARHLHVEPAPSRLEKLIAADTALWTRPNSAMMAWAAQLQAAGVRTGILSNLGDCMETGVLARFPTLAAFDHSVFSHRLGIAKPDPAIYGHAASGLDTPAQRILFIDDRADNVAGAIAAGMQAIQYRDHDSFEKEMVARGWQSLLHPSAKCV